MTAFTALARTVRAVVVVVVAWAAGEALVLAQTTPAPPAPAQSSEFVQSVVEVAKDFGLGSAAGAVFGGLVSFMFNLELQRRKRREDAAQETERWFFSGLRAQFALLGQLTWARHIRVEYLDAARSNPDRHQLRAYGAGVNYQTIDVAALSYMLNDESGATLLGRLLHAESLLASTVSILKRRDQLCEEFRHHPDDGVAKTALVSATNDLYNFADVTLDALYEQFSVLRLELSKRFADRAGLVLNFDKDW